MPAAGYEIDFLKVRGIDRRNPLRAARAVGEAVGAVGAARRALRRREADVVLGGGGYVAGPAGLAAVFSGTPLVLSEADSHLGLANRLLAGRARRVCLAFPIAGREGERYLHTGRPVPAAMLKADRATARERFGIATEARCLLVMGGSQGALSINLAAVEAFAEGEGSGDRDFHVIHLTGRRDHAELRAAPGRGAARRPLHAGRLRAQPRRCACGLRPGPGPLGRLDLRGDGGRPSGDPRSLSARDRRPPECQRRMDGRGRRCRADRGRDAERASCSPSGRCAARRWRAACRDGECLGLARPPDAARRIAGEVLAAVR